MPSSEALWTPLDATIGLGSRIQQIPGALGSDNASSPVGQFASVTISGASTAPCILGTFSTHSTPWLCLGCHLRPGDSSLGWGGGRPCPHQSPSPRSLAVPRGHSLWEDDKYSQFKCNPCQTQSCRSQLSHPLLGAGSAIQSKGQHCLMVTFLIGFGSL